MNKNSIGAILMTVLLFVMMYFMMKTCDSNSGDNFAELDYSGYGNDVSYEQTSKGEENKVSGETDLVYFEFSTKGAALSSYKITSKHKEIPPVELVLPIENKLPYKIYWGNDRRNPDNTIYNFEDKSEKDKFIYQFSATILDNNKNPFNITKTFTLLKDNYFFTLEITFSTEDNEIPAIGKDGYSYSVYYGPQLGPEYKKLSKKNAQYNEERLIHENYKDRKGKIKNKILMRSEIIENTRETDSKIQYYIEPMESKRMEWIALSGKYFLFIADIPRQTKHLYYVSDSVFENEFDNKEFEMVYENEFFFTQEEFKNHKDLTNKFYFYMGPRNSDYLKKAQMAFGRTDLDFSSLSSNGFLGLNVIMKEVIGFINYGINNTGVGNWGWSIIIFTIILKVLLFGLTRKSYESTSKMQQMGPKITELKEKYKDKPQEMNAAMATLYKTEGINPMMGCLPMLIQLPILIAVYAFINNSYELRGAPFILWMTDLSAPDDLVPFANPLPLLNWTSFNLLPFLYIITQLISTIIMQPKTVKVEGKKQFNAQNFQMKFMQYGLPLIFFFLLYDAPSGLFVYWITMNIITVIQQLLYNKFYKDKKPSDKNKKENKLKLTNKTTKIRKA